MKRREHAQAHLPPLDPDDALRLVGLLQRVAHAIWRAHGLEMNERLLDRHFGANPEPLYLEDADDLPF